MDIREIQSHELQLLLGLYAHLHERDDPPASVVVAEAVWAEALANPRIKYFAGFAAGALLRVVRSQSFRTSRAPAGLTA